MKYRQWTASITQSDALTGVIAYLRKEVIVDLHAAIGEQLREVGGRADEEVVAHNFRYRPLILIAVLYLIPISILKQSRRKSC